MNDESEQTETPGPRIRPRSRWRLAGWLALGLLLPVALAAGWVWLYLPDRDLEMPDWLETRIEARLARAVPSLDLDVGDMALVVERGWGPMVRLRDVDVSQAGGRHLISLTHIDTRLSLRALLQGEVRPRDIQLSGAFVTLRRDREGNFDLALPESGAVLGEAGDLAGIAEAVERLLTIDQLDGLRRAGLRALTVRYEDERSGRFMTVDGGRVRLSRDGDRVEIAGDFALLGGGARAATLTLDYQGRIGAPAAGFALRFEDMEAADIAAQSPALAWLSVLRAPISGALRAGLDETGTLEPLNATLEIGQGVLQPTAETRPLPFESARAYASYDPATGTLRFDELSLTSAWASASAEGKAMLQAGPSGWPQSMLGQFTLTGITADPEGLYPEPVAFDRADMDFRLTLDPFRLELGQMTVSDAGRPLRLKGALAAAPEGWELALDADLAEIGPERVLSYWPQSVKPKTRRWVAENILEARLRNAHFALRLRPGAPPRTSLNFDFADASLLFLKTLPPIEGASGHFTLEGDRVVAVAEGGQVTAPQGGAIDVAGTTFVVPDVGINPPPAEIRVKTESTVTAALALLDEEPFRFLTRAGRDVALADGRAALDIAIDLPLKKDLPIADVAYAATGTVRDVRSEVLVKDRVLASPELTVTADRERVEIAGAGRIGRVPFDGSWTLPLGQGPGAPARVEAEVELSERFMDEFRIGLPPGSVSGQGTGRVEIELARDQPAAFRMTSGLEGLGLRLDPLGWALPRGASGRLEVTGALSSPPRIDSLSLDAPGLEARGNVSLTASGTMEQAVFQRVQAGGWLDAPVTLTGRGRGAAPKIAVAGGSMDMRALPAMSRGEGGGPVTLSLDRLQITEGIALTGLRGEFDTAGGLSGSFAGLINGQAQVSGRVVPQNGRSAFQITSADAGAVFRAAGLLRKAEGGNLTLSMVPRGEEGTFRGQLRVTNTRLRDAPAMAALLHAISIVGLLEQLGGEGIHFSEVDADFSLTPQQVVVTRSSAIGPSMGFSMDGYYDLGSGRMDMQGVLSPLYLVNGIGSILTRKGEGLIGFNFGLKGTAQDPRVLVNPLSVFTPGMFREIFRRPPPQPSQ